MDKVIEKPNKVRVVLAGNVDYLKQLQRKYGSQATISSILANEKGA